MKLTFKNIKNKVITTLQVIGALLFSMVFWYFVFTLFFKGCITEPTPPHSNKDSLNTIISSKESANDTLLKNNKALKAERDSLKALKPKYIKGKDRVKDSLIFVSDSVCIRNLTILYNECQKIDSVNNQIITNQESHIMNDSQIIGNLADIIAIQKHRIKTDSVDIEYLTLTVKKEKRKGKLKTILGSALGVLGGIGIGSFR